MITELEKLIDALQTDYGNSVQLTFNMDGSGSIDDIGDYGEIEETIEAWNSLAEFECIVKMFV